MYRIKFNKYILIVLIAGCAVLFAACKKPLSRLAAPLFEVLNDTKTNLHFVNNLKPTPEFNMLKYMYYYNGAGVGAGDFNNDGKIDLFFAGNQVQNTMYLCYIQKHWMD